jgi:hypothetical protein
MYGPSALSRNNVRQLDYHTRSVQCGRVVTRGSAIPIAPWVARLTGFSRLGQLRKGTDHGSHGTGHVARKIRNLLR